MRKKILALNPVVNPIGGGISRTIVSEYAKRGWSCIFRNDGFRITAIAEIYEEENDTT